MLAWFSGEVVAAGVGGTGAIRWVGVFECS